ncbi:hypothetical protein X975_01746, partial [Stegodyphus mimosarum]
MRGPILIQLNKQHGLTLQQQLSSISTSSNITVITSPIFPRICQPHDMCFG